MLHLILLKSTPLKISSTQLYNNNLCSQCAVLKTDFSLSWLIGVTLSSYHWPQFPNLDSKFDLWELSKLTTACLIWGRSWMKLSTIQIQLPCFFLNISYKFRDLLNSIFTLHTDFHRSQCEITGKKEFLSLDLLKLS